MSPSKMLRLCLLAATVAALLPGSSAVAAPAARPAQSGPLFSASAFGTKVTVRNTVTSGPTAPVGLGNCGTFEVPVIKRNGATGVNDPPRVRTGSIDTSAETFEDQDRVGARGISTVRSLNVLAGTVKATEAHAVSESFRTDGGFDSSGAGSTMTGLEVLGVPFEGTPDPNTQIQLPGLGYVVLNEQIKSVTNGKASLTVNMVHVVITVPNPFVQVGTNIIVADAVSRTTDQIPGTVAATAYGAQANVGGKVLLGRLTQSSIGCLGGEKSNSLLGVDDPPVLRSGTQATHAVGSVSPSQSMSEATATIQDVDVAEGTVTGDLVTAQASASNDGTNVSLSDQGSGFVNIKVLGQAIGDNVPPNTMMQLPGLGTLWLHRVILTSASIEVRMIELIVTEQNPIGLDVGTNIKVAVAIASAQHSESARQ